MTSPTDRDASASTDRRRLIVMGGGAFSTEPENPLLDDYILSHTQRERPRVCFIPTASADSENYLLRFYRAFSGRSCRPAHLALFTREQHDLRQFIFDQDVIYVGGGNTVNLLAIWRAHGLDEVLREAWEAGIICCGVSAGMNCWFDSSVTTSFGPMGPVHDGLGFLPGSACPHFDGEPLRRPTYHRLVGEGVLPAGIGVDDGAAAHFIGTRLHEAVCSRPNARVYRIERSGDGDGIIETPLPTRYLQTRQ